MNFMPLDIFFLVVIGIAVVRCIFKGFVSELFSFLAVVGGIIIAFLFNDLVAGYINNMTKVSQWNTIIAFLVLFLAVYIIVKILEKIIQNVLDKLHLEKLDKALGLFLGLIEGAVIVIVIIFLMNMIPIQRLHDFMAGSYLIGLVNGIFDWTPGMVNQILPTSV